MFSLLAGSCAHGFVCSELAAIQACTRGTSPGVIACHNLARTCVQQQLAMVPDLLHTTGAPFKVPDATCFSCVFWVRSQMLFIQHLGLKAHTTPMYSTSHNPKLACRKEVQQQAV